MLYSKFELTANDAHEYKFVGQRTTRCTLNRRPPNEQPQSNLVIGISSIVQSKFCNVITNKLERCQHIVSFLLLVTVEESVSGT